jgi:hypothetical protein
MPLNFVDSPATTSATTYTVYMLASSASAYCMAGNAGRCAANSNVLTFIAIGDCRMIEYIMQLQALYKLYPQVVTTRGDEAFDADGNQVQYDLQAVTTQAQKDDCKQHAKAKLAASDWST